ncbi:MAG: polymorphic toxin-type HINT domain-containing protein [Pseudomonadales bacterium]
MNSRSTRTLNTRSVRTARRSLARPQRGAAIAELVVVLPALLMLGLGVLESALFYQAKTTVTYATFEAARKGATTHAQKTPMREEFGMRIATIYGGDGSGGKAQGAIVEGQIDAHNPLITTIDIINPNSEAFLEFGVENSKTGQLEIPNTHLRYRDPTVIGSESEVNVQDANLLKIQAEYGYQLRVPLVAQAVTSIMKQFDPDNARYYDQGRIPISAVATVRMQSAAWENGNLNADGTAPGDGDVVNGVAGDPDQRGGDPKGSPNDIDGDGVPNSSDPDIDGDGVVNADDVDADGNGISDAEEKNPNEVECETNWDDERYQSIECDRWYCELQEFTSEIRAAANVIWDFLEGFVAGIGQQISDLWELLKDPSVLLDVAKAFIDDPRGTIEAIIESVAQDVEKVLECGPADIGRIVGQNVNPATPLRVLSKLADVSKNARLSAYVKKKERGINCASFPEQTLIWTDAGLVAIEELVVAQIVASRDVEKYAASRQPITQKFSRVSDKVQKIRTEFGEILLTPEHPLWVQGQGWVEAKDVQWEDPIATIHGDVVAYENEQIEKPIQVHNFSVANTHTYFAGPMGIWVHNANCEGSVIGNNSKLRETIDPDGNYKGKGWQAHHLIPSKIAENSRILRIAAKRGVYDQNSVFNGIMLPGKKGAQAPDNVAVPDRLPIHKSNHTSGDKSGNPSEPGVGYQKNVENRLTSLERRFDAAEKSGQPWSDEKLATEVQKMQDVISDDLMNGKLLLCESCGPQEWKN